MSILKIKNGNSWDTIPVGGVGVPSGGSAGQVLTKSSSTDYATEWAAPSPMLFPDYSDLLADGAGSSYSFTATKPCYFQGVIMAGSSSYAVQVNGITVSTVNNTGSTYAHFAAGYMKTGDVLTLVGGGSVKIWGLRT